MIVDEYSYLKTILNEYKELSKFIEEDTVNNSSGITDFYRMREYLNKNSILGNSICFIINNKTINTNT